MARRSTAGIGVDMAIRPSGLVQAELNDAMQDLATALRDVAKAYVVRAEAIDEYVSGKDAPGISNSFAMRKEALLSEMRIRECEQKCTRLLVEMMS